MLRTRQQVNAGEKAFTCGIGQHKRTLVEYLPLKTPLVFNELISTMMIGPACFEGEGVHPQAGIENLSCEHCYTR